MDIAPLILNLSARLRQVVRHWNLYSLAKEPSVFTEEKTVWSPGLVFMLGEKKIFLLLLDI
jgi:hypothetical protein